MAMRMVKLTLLKKFCQINIKAKMSEQRKGGDDFRNLHEKLKSEAENIVRWKASAEVKARQVEKDLKEAEATVSDLRRNVLDLQLHSEHLSQGLLKERRERSLVESKVTFAEQRLSELQQQVQELGVSLDIFKKDKDNLITFQSKLEVELTDLTLKSRKISEDAQIKVQNVTVKAQTEVGELEQQLLKKSKELQRLKTLNEQEIERNHELTASLNTTATSLLTTQQELTSRTVELKKIEASFQATKEDLQEKIQKLTAQVDEYELKLKMVQSCLEESKKEFSEAVEKIQFLKITNDTLEGSNSELCDKLDAIVARKRELEQEATVLTDKINVLMTNCNEVQTKNKHLLGQISELTQTQKMLNSDIEDLQLKNVNLETDLSAKLEELLSQQAVCEQLRTEIASQVQESQKQQEEHKKLELVKEQLSEKIGELQAKFSEQKTIYDRLQEELQTSEQHQEALKLDIVSLNDQLSHERGTLQSTMAAYEQKIQELRSLASEEKAAYQIKLTALDASLLKAKDEAASHLEEIKTLSDTKEQIVSQLVGLRKELKENEKLQSEKLNVEATLANLKEEAEELQCNIKSKEELISKLQDSVKSTTAESENIKRELLEAQCKIEDYTAELKSKEEDYTAQLKCKEEDYARQLKNKEEGYTQHMKNKEEDYEQQLKSKQEDYSQQLRNIEEDHAQLLKSKEDYYAQKLRNREEDYTQQLKSKEEDYTQQLKTKDEDCAIRLKSKEEEYTAQLKSKEEELKSASSAFQELQSSYECKVEELGVLPQLQEEVSSLKAKLETALYEKGKAEIDMQTAESGKSEKIKETNEILNRYKAQYDAQLQQYQEANEKANKRIAQYEINIQQYQEQLKVLKESLAAAKSELETAPRNSSGGNKLQEASFTVPKVPAMKRTSTPKKFPESVEEDDSAKGILKQAKSIDKRRLLISQPKRVVFMPQIHEGDSSSDALGCESIDSDDDSFDKLRRSVKSPSHSLRENPPRTNVVNPFNIGKCSSSIVGDASKTPKTVKKQDVSAKKRKQGDLSPAPNKKVKHSYSHPVKTYSGMSPKDRHSLDKRTSPSEKKTDQNKDWIL